MHTHTIIALVFQLMLTVQNNPFIPLFSFTHLQHHTPLQLATLYAVGGEKSCAKILTRMQRSKADVQLSKRLSYMLRHGAQKEGLGMRADGYVSVLEILRKQQFRGKTLEDIRLIVETNDKQRFNLREEEGVWMIRANQGHSVAVQELELEEIVDPQACPVAVHGTYTRYWESIASTGLKVMNRNHIHLAVGRIGEDGVTSGMRTNCTLLVYLDVPKAMRDGIRFYRSTNNVILTTGHPDPDGGKGVVRPEYFVRVETKDGRVLAENGHIL
jgi:2'-phosphotransferase